MPQLFTRAQMERLKREAKRIKKANNITQAQALNQIAQRYDYKDWPHFMSHGVMPEPNTEKQNGNGDSIQET